MFLYFAHALWMEKTRRAGKLGFIPAFFALPGTVKQARRDATACMHVKPLASTTKEVVAQMRDLKNQVTASGALIDPHASPNANPNPHPHRRPNPSPNPIPNPLTLSLTLTLNRCPRPPWGARP